MYCSSSSPLVLLCSYADLFSPLFFCACFWWFVAIFPWIYCICSLLWTKSKWKNSVHVYEYYLFRVNISDWLSIILQIAYIVIFQQDYVLTPMLLQTWYLRLKLHDSYRTVHKLPAVPSISHIPKWKSLRLKNWSVFMALGHWGLLKVMPLARSVLWQEGIDFLITISLFAEHLSCVICWTINLIDNEPYLLFRDIQWLIQHIHNFYKM